MPDNGLRACDRILEKTHQFINNVSATIDVDDKHMTFIGIKAVLYALRDRIP